MHLFRRTLTLFFLTIALSGFSNECEDECFVHYNAAYFPFYVSIEEGYMTFNAPKTFSGVLTVTATGVSDYFSPLVSSGRTDSNYTRLNMGVLLPWFTIEGSAFYYDDEQHSDFSFVTTQSSAFIFQGINGVDSAPFGFLAGATVAGALFNEFIYWGLEIEIETNWNFCFRSFEFFPFFEFDYSKITQNYNTIFGSSNGVTTSHINTALDESLSTSYYDCGVGIKFDGFICSPVFVIGDIGIYASYARSRLYGQQLYAQNIAAVIGTQVENVNVISINKNQFQHKFKAGLEVGLGWNHYAISIVGNVENWGYLGQIVNPFENPGSTKIGGVHNFLGSVGLKLTAFY